MLSELQPICLIMAVLFASVFVVAGISKFRETYRARNWTATVGRVTESKVRSVRDRANETQAYESMPLVVYEYYVDGTKYRGTKINFADKITGEDVAPTLEKYPFGKTVQVYYNPANPNQAVLEHDFPKWLYAGLVAIILAILGLGLGMPFLFDFASRAVEGFAPNADNAAPATLLCGMGIFALLIGLALQKQVVQSRNWQTTTGKVLDNSVQGRDSWDSDGRYTRLYNSEVVYSFEVGRQQYISDRVALGGTVRSSVNRSVPTSVISTLGKYPKGANVKVYYNPKNPADCALELRANGLWLVLFVALVFIGLSVWMLGIFQR